MTVDEYMNEVELLKFDHQMKAIPCVKYLNRQISVDQIPSQLIDIRNMDEAFSFIKQFNERVTALGNYSASFLDKRAPTVDQYFILFKANEEP